MTPNPCRKGASDDRSRTFRTRHRSGEVKENIMMRIPIDERVLRLAATLPPDEADHLLRSWRHHKTVHTSDELEELYRSFHAQRRGRAQKELERLYGLKAGDSEAVDSGVVRDSDNTNEPKPVKTVLTRLDERIARLAASGPPDEAAELLDWWRWYKTTATDGEMEEFERSHFGPKAEGEDGTNRPPATL
jgi:hypothetical protein